MSINTKLVLLLTVSVGAVMFVASFLSLRQREAALEAATRDELRAHAVTLSIALEENYAAGQTLQGQKLIDRLRENTKIFAVLLFDLNGNLIAQSQPETIETFVQPPELKTVLASGETIEFVRRIEGHKFASVIVAMKNERGSGGAVEIVKPLALVEADIFRARLNWISTTLLLLAVIFLVVYTVLQRNLSRPIGLLLGGAEAVGGGNLNYRVQIPASEDELSRLAAAFNQMAENLAAQKNETERETENRLRLERELRHSERLAAVGRLAAGVAHELGAPLNVIDARAEQLLAKPNHPIERRERNLTIIRDQTERISNIVRQLLNLARPYNFRLAKVNLNDLIEHALEQFDENARRADVVCEMRAEREFKIEADEDFLRQVFVNILNNAVQAMPDGGELKIEIGAENRDGKTFAAVHVADTGAGIAAEHLEKIFDPFYTTKDIGEGTGLGLAVASRIIEEHGGKIVAANHANGGAVFTIHLPLIDLNHGDTETQS